MFNFDRKKQAKERFEKRKDEYENLLITINSSVNNLYSLRKSASEAILRVEDYINTLANTPKELKKDVEDIVLSIQPFRSDVELASKIDSGLVDVGNLGIAGLGTAIGAVGAAGAMAFATTFGVASTCYECGIGCSWWRSFSCRWRWHGSRESIIGCFGTNRLEYCRTYVGKRRV